MSVQNWTEIVGGNMSGRGWSGIESNIITPADGQSISGILIRNANSNVSDFSFSTTINFLGNGSSHGGIVFSYKRNALTDKFYMIALRRPWFTVTLDLIKDSTNYNTGLVKSVTDLINIWGIREATSVKLMVEKTGNNIVAKIFNGLTWVTALTHTDTAGYSSGGLGLGHPSIWDCVTTFKIESVSDLRSKKIFMVT